MLPELRAAVATLPPAEASLLLTDIAAITVNLSLTDGPDAAIAAINALPAENRRRMVESLVTQVQALQAQLEYHLLGNHLLENAITLCWAGLSLETPLAHGWLPSTICSCRHAL